MSITGIKVLDRHIQRYGLVNHDVHNPIQTCIEIEPDATRQMIRDKVKAANIGPLPYFLQRLLFEEFDGREKWILHRLHLHNGKPLLWLLINEKGKLIDKAFSSNRHKDQQVCHTLVSYIQKKAIPNRAVHYA